MFHGRFDATTRINVLSVEEFVMNPYSFEPEYGSDEGSSTSGDKDDGQDDRSEEGIERLVSLDWYICENGDTEMLNHPRERVGRCLKCQSWPILSVS